MAKRNKGGKTPSAKAARNLEALKKAKEAVEASAKVETTKVEDSKPEEKKPEEKPAEQKKGGVYQTPMGKSYNGDDIRLLPNGSGYMYLRMAVRKVIDMFRNLCDNFILIGHTKEKMINKEGEELSEMALDLVGRLGDIVCGEADAVGYVYRKKNETIISFEGGDNSVREARAPHLRGKKIVIAESDENNVINVHWDKIYLDECAA